MQNKVPDLTEMDARVRHAKAFVDQSEKAIANLLDRGIRTETVEQLHQDCRKTLMRVRGKRAAALLTAAADRVVAGAAV